MPKFRNNSSEIEAIQWTGYNATEIMLFVGMKLNFTRPPHAMELDRDDIPKSVYIITIPTLEGNMTAQKGDYIIKSEKGEFYPCKPDVFNINYEAI